MALYVLFLTEFSSSTSLNPNVSQMFELELFVAAEADHISHCEEIFHSQEKPCDGTPGNDQQTKQKKESHIGRATVSVKVAPPQKRSTSDFCGRKIPATSSGFAEVRPHS